MDATRTTSSSNPAQPGRGAAVKSSQQKGYGKTMKILAPSSKPCDINYRARRIAELTAEIRQFAESIDPEAFTGMELDSVMMLTDHLAVAAEALKAASPAVKKRSAKAVVEAAVPADPASCG